MRKLGAAGVRLEGVVLRLREGVPRAVAIRIMDVLDLDYGAAMARFFIVITMVVHTVADRAALAAENSAALIGSPDELAERLVHASLAILRGADT